MSYSVQYPTQDLSPFIKKYWAMDGTVGSDAGHLQRIVPMGMADLIFYFNDLPENIDRSESLKSRSVINGQQTNYYDLKVVGRINLFSVTFTPQGTRQFFNIPLTEIHNRNLPLRFLAGSIADEMEDRLFHANNFYSRVKIIEKHLMKKLDEQRRFEFQRMNRTISNISRSRGLSNIDSLASDACLSRKQFERVFSDYIGLTPLQFMRVLRFQNAIDIKAKKAEISLTELAYSSGYFDQSHMVREFKRISGHTPGKYFSSCDPESDYFN